MDIISRLKKFLGDTGISNSQFADTCVIPRPTLSQLLNGRNKKVSDEVISKIHRAYPSLNIMWLLFGDGEMLNGDVDNLNGNDSQVEDMTNGTAHLNNNNEESGLKAISFDDPSEGGYRPAAKSPQRMATPSSMSETIQSIMRSTAAAGHGSKRGAEVADRRVVKMLVFYSDGRFDEFEPTIRNNNE